MLNATGGGTLASMQKGFVYKTPDLVIDPSIPAEEIVSKVDALF